LSTCRPQWGTGASPARTGEGAGAPPRTENGSSSAGLRLLRHRRNESERARIRRELSSMIHLVSDGEPKSGQAALLLFEERHRLRGEIAARAQLLHVVGERRVELFDDVLLRIFLGIVARELL